MCTSISAMSHFVLVAQTRHIHYLIVPPFCMLGRARLYSAQQYSSSKRIPKPRASLSRSKLPLAKPNRVILRDQKIIVLIAEILAPRRACPLSEPKPHRSTSSPRPPRCSHGATISRMLTDANALPQSGSVLAECIIVVRHSDS